MKITMKYLVLLLLLQFCIQYIYCNESILFKFHQTGYKVKDLRMETISYDNKYFNFFELKSVKFNRTTTALNFTMNMKVTMKDKMELLVQSFKFLSNEYRHIPSRFQINLKKAVDANVIGLATIKNYGNMETFSFEKDVTYYAINFSFDESRLPPFVPDGRYKTDIKFLYLNEETAFITVFDEIYTPIAYPKN